jgi:hypothetical protein
MKLNTTFLIRLTTEQKSFLNSLPNASAILRSYINALQLTNNELKK